jgi:hypothetical protein
MVAGCALSWLAVALALGLETGVPVLFGMAAPLAMASGTWMVTERLYRRTPERVTSVMVAAFAGKMVFFGAYVAVALSVFSLRPVPFVVSFTGYFIALHLTEAWLLRRLFAGGQPVSPARE